MVDNPVERFLRKDSQGNFKVFCPFEGERNALPLDIDYDFTPAEEGSDDLGTFVFKSGFGSDKQELMVLVAYETRYGIGFKLPENSEIYLRPPFKPTVNGSPVLVANRFPLTWGEYATRLQQGRPIVPITRIMVGFLSHLILTQDEIADVDISALAKYDPFSLKNRNGYKKGVQGEPHLCNVDSFRVILNLVGEEVHMAGKLKYSVTLGDDFTREFEIGYAFGDPTITTFAETNARGQKIRGKTYSQSLFSGTGGGSRSTRSIGPKGEQRNP